MWSVQRIWRFYYSCCFVFATRCSAVLLHLPLPFAPCRMPQRLPRRCCTFQARTLLRKPRWCDCSPKRSSTAGPSYYRSYGKPGYGSRYYCRCYCSCRGCSLEVDNPMEIAFCCYRKQFDASSDSCRPLCYLLSLFAVRRCIVLSSGTAEFLLVRTYIVMG